MSNEANLTKLLRTLTRYEAKLLILAPQHPPKLKVADGWHSIEEHPELNSDEIEAEARALLGEDFDRLKEEEIVHKKIADEEFEFEWGDSQNGNYLTVRRTEALKDLSENSGLRAWLKNGGILVVKNKNAYSSVLKAWSQHAKGVALSLERSGQASKSYLGLVLNFKWGKDFLELEEGLRKAAELKADLIALKELPLNREELTFLEKFAKKAHVLILEDLFQSLSFEGNVLFLN